MTHASPAPEPVPVSPLAPRRFVVVSLEHAARLFPAPESTCACDEALSRHGGAVVAVLRDGALTFEPIDNGREISDALDSIEGMIVFQLGNEAPLSGDTATRDTVSPLPSQDPALAAVEVENARLRLELAAARDELRMRPISAFHRLLGDALRAAPSSMAETSMVLRGHFMSLGVVAVPGADTPAQRAIEIVADALLASADAPHRLLSDHRLRLDAALDLLDQEMAGRARRAAERGIAGTTRLRDGWHAVPATDRAEARAWLRTQAAQTQVIAREMRGVRDFGRKAAVGLAVAMDARAWALRALADLGMVPPEHHVVEAARALLAVQRRCSGCKAPATKGILGSVHHDAIFCDACGADPRAAEVVEDAPGAAAIRKLVALLGQPPILEAPPATPAVREHPASLSR